MKQTVQAISGGMDSTCLLLRNLEQGYRIHLLSFYYGQRHALELERLDANLRLFAERGDLEERISHVRVRLDIGSFLDSALTDRSKDMPEGHYAEENMKATVVPNRNAMFHSILFAKALSLAQKTGRNVEVCLGVHAGDHAIYPDCREGNLRALHAAFQMCNWGGESVELCLPFAELDKVTILKRGLECCQVLGLDFDQVLANTNTSYAPNQKGEASGRTGSDVERILAFHALGRRDPVPYEGGWEMALAYALQKEDEFQTKNK